MTYSRIRTLIEPIDNFLDGGVPENTVTIIQGPVGVGKSTLALNFASGASNNNWKVLFHSARKANAKERAARLCEIKPGKMFDVMEEETIWEAVTDRVLLTRPNLVLIDDYQYVRTKWMNKDEPTRLSMDVGMVKWCQNITQIAPWPISFVLLGYPRKDGSYRGSHEAYALADAVLSIRHTPFRVAGEHKRAIVAEKSRYCVHDTSTLFRFDQEGRLVFEPNESPAPVTETSDTP